MSEVKQCPFCGEKPTVVVDNKLEDALLARAEKLRAALLEIFNACVRADINGELSEYINGDILDQARDALDVSAKVTARQVAENAKNLQRAEKAEADLAVLREQTRWIPVSERLPDHKQSVLAVADREVTNTYYDVNFRKWSQSKYYWFPEGEVTHWMPLPEPPEDKN